MGRPAEINWRRQTEIKEESTETGEREEGVVQRRCRFSYLNLSKLPGLLWWINKLLTSTWCAGETQPPRCPAAVTCRSDHSVPPPSPDPSISLEKELSRRAAVMCLFTVFPDGRQGSQGDGRSELIS